MISTTIYYLSPITLVTITFGSVLFDQLELVQLTNFLTNFLVNRTNSSNILWTTIIFLEAINNSGLNFFE